MVCVKLLSAFLGCTGKTAFGHDFKALHQETEEKKNLEMMFRGIVQPLTFIFGASATKIPTEWQKQLKKATLASEKVFFFWFLLARYH